jgi:UDP:flavonoid glycosyltransferase YjiC (YdhE family)
MLLIPMGADQPLNAARCVALGVAQELDALEASPQMVLEAAAQLLAEPAYRQAAGRISAEIAALPGLEQALPLLERLVAS